MVESFGSAKVLPSSYLFLQAEPDWIVSTEAELLPNGALSQYVISDSLAFISIILT